jgi:hypothetical protein
MKKWFWIYLVFNLLPCAWSQTPTPKINLPVCGEWLELPPGCGNQTELQGPPIDAKRLSRFKCKSALGCPLRKDTLYEIVSFSIIQKINGGYLITGTAFCPGGIVAFLKTTKQLAQDLIIYGVVYYSGDYQYTANTGYQKSVPILKIFPDQPLWGIRRDGPALEKY